MTQKQMRRDMLRLYGNKKRLIPRRMAFRASEVPSLVPFLMIQVTSNPGSSMGSTPMTIPAAIFCGKQALSTYPEHCQLQKGPSAVCWDCSALLTVDAWPHCPPHVMPSAPPGPFSPLPRPFSPLPRAHLALWPTPV